MAWDDEKDKPQWRKDLDKKQEEWRNPQWRKDLDAKQEAWRNPEWRKELEARQEAGRTENAPWRKELEAKQEAWRNPEWRKRQGNEEWRNPWARRTPVYGRETGVVRKRLFGHQEIAQRFIGPARLLLGQLKEDMGFNSLQQGVRRAVIPIQERVEYGSLGSATGAPSPNNDWILNPTGEASETNEVEHHVTGKVLLSAISVHGQDEVWIDARAVVIREERKQGGLEYFPYLWVGVRAVSGGDGWANTGACTDELPGNDFCVGVYGGDYHILLITERLETFNPQLMLNVWEPLPEGDPIENTIMSNRGHYTPEASAANYPLRDPKHFYIGTFDYPEDENGWIQDNLPDDRVSYNDNNLYCIGGPFAWDPLNDGKPAEEQQLWEQVVLLDPEDKKKHWTSTFAYKTVTDTIGPVALSDGGEWSLPGKVLGGDYLINVSFRGPNCDSHCPNNIPGPVDILIEVRLGKAPGRTSRTRFTFTIPASRGEARASIPYGFRQDFDITGAQGNPHDINWFPGAIRANVALGTVGYDPDVVPRGLGGGEPCDLVCERQAATRGLSFAEACPGPFTPGSNCFGAITYDTESEGFGTFPFDLHTRVRKRKRLWGYTALACDGTHIINMITSSGVTFPSECEGHPLAWTDWVVDPPSGYDWNAATGAPGDTEGIWPADFTYKNEFAAHICRPCGKGAAEWEQIFASGNYCFIDE